MKKIISTLVFLASTTASAACITADGYEVPVGKTVELYMVDTNVKVGPAYRCGGMKRTKTCVGNIFSGNPVECSQYDSGACVDNWIDQLDDSNFNFLVCKDQ